MDLAIAIPIRTIGDIFLLENVRIIGRETARLQAVVTARRSLLLDLGSRQGMRNGYASGEFYSLAGCHGMNAKMENIR